ncbi:MAG TPA: hypothetical protein VFR58_03990 [Flavisolibacter sp.]|nr:hypothetical protein [Flavisolibacter sp.]
MQPKIDTMQTPERLAKKDLIPVLAVLLLTTGLLLFRWEKTGLTGPCTCTFPSTLNKNHNMLGKMACRGEHRRRYSLTEDQELVKQLRVIRMGARGI